MKIDTKCEAHVIRAKCTLEQTHHHTDKDESHIIARGFHAFIGCRASQENIASSSFTPDDGKAFTAELLREKKEKN